ncbi:dihydrolipoyl dehydrogenase [Anoxynatronum buryatiense]|uniref:Dihydrolipoyl dehydrogenase n=1 Tax=Anoxynatronum buryatiense TaxID=489973 RepID=A0AA45WX14_9CLOT|nr:dihydrolipoyl dehydrogenase [Anoxynatronum buryatiense]SMP60415.1 dihydrolipoamide dehydrogenase [Anoxynatronum buryatiense]
MRIVVIGGGPGGYVAAIRAAQLGGEVTLVEKASLGGTCLNVGCIPTKVLAHSTELLQEIRHAETYGLEVPAVSVNWPRLQERKQAVVNQLVEGVGGLLRSWNVEVIQAEASFANEQELLLKESSGGTRLLPFDKAILAAGSESVQLPLPGADHPGILTSTEALSLETIPESLCVIGGGVIGTEFAGIYAGMGTKVTVIEMLPEILVNMEPELTAMVQMIMEEEGVQFHTDTQVKSIEKTPAGFVVNARCQGQPVTVAAQHVLMAAGRRPATASLGLEKAGIRTEKGRVLVNDRLQTSLPHVYAIGDCTGGTMLAHTASAQGVAAAETIMGHYTEARFDTIPSCVYIRPEYASVGLTEAAAKAKGYAVKTGKFALTGNGKALIMNNGVGMVKFVADAATDEVLGLHILGPRATDLISEGTLALRLEATLKEIGTTIHAHPTLAEAILEAAHAAQGHCIHMPKP